MAQAARKFAHRKAVRGKIPLLIGLYGPSGSGKTYTALRLATGIVEVSGGPIFFVDTENGRAKHYADRFDFEHVPFDPPYPPTAYLQAFRYCVEQGAGIIIADSMSHEHEGEGGVLDWHEAEIDRMLGNDKNDWKKREARTWAGWVKPKAARTKLVHFMQRSPVHIITCYRAKPKLSIKKGKDPVSRGWQPIGGDEYVYEQTLHCLLEPGSNGVPTWNPEEQGERQIIKLPVQFREHMLEHKASLDEGIGRYLAEWAAGKGAKLPEPKTNAEKALGRQDADTRGDVSRDPPVESPLDEAMRRIEASTSVEELQSVRDALAGERAWSADDGMQIKDALDQKRANLSEGVE